MKKIGVAFIGSLLFIAGHNQVHKQTEYASAKAMLVSPAPSAKPMDIPGKTSPIFALRLDRSFLGGN